MTFLKGGFYAVVLLLVFSGTPMGNNKRFNTDVNRLDNMRTAESRRVDDLIEAGNNKILTAALSRIDDMRTAESRRIDGVIEAEQRRVNEQMVLHAKHDIELSVAEAKRIDAIRVVDVNAVSVANERATQQAAVLANQVQQSAENLRALVAATAATVAQQLTQVSTQFTERLSSLEKAQYEKQGSGTGMRDMWGWVFAAIMGLATVGSIAYGVLHTAGK